jgi:hypothetical protein
MNLRSYYNFFFLKRKLYESLYVFMFLCFYQLFQSHNLSYIFIGIFHINLALITIVINFSDKQFFMFCFNLISITEHYLLFFFLKKNG